MTSKRLNPTVPPHPAPKPDAKSEAKKAEPWDGWVKRIRADKTLSKEDRRNRITLCPMLRMNDYIPVWPSPYQAAFMIRTEREMLFGGEARAGKTYSLLMAALQYVDVPGYHALIVRRTEGELREASSIIPTLLEWIKGKGVEWNEQRFEATFPSGATISFGFIKIKGDEKSFRGRAYQFIGYEELTLWEETREWHPYSFLFRSLVPHPTAKIPLRMRSTTNPDGPGKPWVKGRFLGPESQRFKIANSYMAFTVNEKRPDLRRMDRVYIHGVKDESLLDVEEYELSIILMDPVEAEQQGGGNWEIDIAGGVFNTGALRLVPFPPQNFISKGRGWDPAATEGGSGARSAGVLISKIDPREARRIYGIEVQYVVEHAIAGRWGANRREDNIDAIAVGGWVELEGTRRIAYPGDGGRVRVYIEQEGAGSGKQVADQTVQRLLGLKILAQAVSARDPKLVRAHHFAAAVNNGWVALVEGTWNDEYIAELNGFPNSDIKDLVDASSLVYNEIMSAPPSAPPATGEQKVHKDQIKQKFAAALPNKLRTRDIFRQMTRR